tara:strand:+ start:817 stop:1833 length:1017 start_codon:yes stop_codon:yes gene_type:complete
LKRLLTLTKILFSTFLIILILETLTRIIFFIPTSADVFKYGFKKSVIFEIVDLSKFQVTIVDTDRKFVKSKQIGSKKIWVFGGSTTAGYNCEGGQSSSWPDQLNKLNKKFSFVNFAFNGANTDQQINLFWKEIIINQPEIIFWANKFNTSNVIGHYNYRNKDLLNYEFSNVRKTKIIKNIKEIDITLKSYSLFYSLMDKILLRFNHIFNDKLNTDTLKVKPSKDDIIYSLKNFEINTIEAIETSKKYGVKEFYLVSLFSQKDLSGVKKNEKIYLYDQTIKKIEKNYFPFVKIIDGISKKNKDDHYKYFCDNLHKTLEGEMVQAKIILNRLISLSKFFK